MAEDGHNDDQPRDERGRFASTGASAYHEKLQTRHKALLDRLEKEDASLPEYDQEGWRIDERSGHDTRKDGGLKRPVVLGEIAHPDNGTVKVPVVFREGHQDTTRPNGGGYGRRHIEFRHGGELRRKGFRDALHFVHHVVNNHDVDVNNPKGNSRVLAIRPERESSNAPTALTSVRMVEKGDHYSIGTAYRGKWRDIRQLEKKEAESSPHSLVHPYGQDGEVIHLGLKRPLHQGNGENSLPSCEEQSTKAAFLQAKPLFAPSYFLPRFE